MHANSGYGHEAMGLVRRFVRVFGDAEAVVTPSGSCAAMVREGYERMAAEAGDEALAAQVRDAGAARVRAVGVPRRAPGGRGRRRVVPPPRHLPPDVPLAAAAEGRRRAACGCCAPCAGIDLVELPAAEQCCGFGGTFAVKNADTSTAMLTDKLRRIIDTGADVCTAADNSCLMHIGGGLRHSRAGVRVMHLAEILAMEDA